MMNNEVVRKALEEYRSVSLRRDEHNAFTRKLYTAREMGIITSEELKAIKEGMEEMKQEKLHEMMKSDARRLDDAFARVFGSLR